MSDISIQDLLQDLVPRSLPKISMRDLYYRSSLQNLFARPLSGKALLKCFSSLQDLFPKPVGEISSQELSTRSLRSLHRSSLQDLFTRPLSEISIQELSTRSLHKTFMRVSTRSLRKTSMRDTRSLHKTSSRDLYTRALYKISSQDLYESLYKISSQDLYERYKISSQDPYERSLYKSSLQSVFTSPKGDVAMQDLLISLDHRGVFTAALCKISSQDLYI